MISPELTYDLVDKEPVWFEKMMLVRIMLDVKFAEKVSTVLFVNNEGQEARSFQMPKHTGIAKALLLYHSHRAPVNPVAWDFLYTCLNQVAVAGLLPVQDLQEVWQYLYAALMEGSGAWDMVVAQTNIGCTYWLKQVRCNAITGRARQDKWRSDALQDALRKENVFIDRITKSNKIQHGLWEQFEVPTIDTERFPLSITGLTARMGGGPGRGECYLIIAASGVGKSVVCTQFCAEWAVQGRKVVYITTERTQPGAQLNLRIFSQQCRIPYAQISNGINYHALQPAQQQAMQQLRGMLTDNNFRYIHWFDRPDSGNLQGMKDEIMRAGDHMGGIDAIAIDWIGGALGEEFKTDKDKLRLIFKSTADFMAGMNSDLNTAGLVMAQGHEKRAKNNPYVDASCLTECLSMHQEMTGVAGLSGIQDKTENAEGFGANYRREQTVFLSKVRKGEGGLVPVTRDFGFQRLTDRQTSY